MRMPQPQEPESGEGERPPMVCAPVVGAPMVCTALGHPSSREGSGVAGRFISSGPGRTTSRAGDRGPIFALTLPDGRRVTITNGDLGDFAGVVRRAVAQAGYALGGDGA